MDGDEKMFHSPKVIMLYSKNGLGAHSCDNHGFIRERLVPSSLLNTWEFVYFDFKHEPNADIAAETKKEYVPMIDADEICSPSEMSLELPLVTRI